MSDQSIGWIAGIIIGGLAGWCALRFMQSGNGIATNIILGIFGASIANFLFGIIGVSFGGWIGYLVAGIIGACLLIWACRRVQGS